MQMSETKNEEIAGSQPIWYDGLEQDPNYAVKSNPSCPTKIFVNHVGFMPEAHKSCTIINPTSTEFIVRKNIVMEPGYNGKGDWSRIVFRGTLQENGNEISPGLIGDFSEIREEGLYQVLCGTSYSRMFTVWKKIYDVPMRVLLNAFQMQRCGDTHLGYAGPCHLDDGRVAESDEHHDFSGGYHQSCDLRKWHMLTNTAHIGLVQFGLNYHAHWDKGAVADEIRWGCDYYHKIIKEDGGIYDSLWIPVGWNARDYYENDSPAVAHWQTVRHQSLAARYFRQSDPTYSQKCLDMALRVWKHITRPDRPAAPYHVPAIPPRGHDGWDSYFSEFYPGSAVDNAFRISAAADLYRATDDKQFLEDLARQTTALTRMQIGAKTKSDAPGSGCFYESAGSTRLSHSYFCSRSMPAALCDALELAPDHPDAQDWRAATRRIAEQSRWVAGRNPWNRIAMEWCEPDAQAGGCGHSTDRVNSSAQPTSKNMPSYRYYSHEYNKDLIPMAAFLRRASAILNEPAYAALAQRQIDWVLGANPFDRSSVEGVGYNQWEHVKTGEVFPPTPQIPGAVHTGYNNEYDLPHTGTLLGALAMWSAGACP